MKKSILHITAMRYAFEALDRYERCRSPLARRIRKSLDAGNGRTRRVPGQF